MYIGVTNHQVAFTTNFDKGGTSNLQTLAALPLHCRQSGRVSLDFSNECIGYWWLLYCHCVGILVKIRAHIKRIWFLALWHWNIHIAWKQTVANSKFLWKKWRTHEVWMVDTWCVILCVSSRLLFLKGQTMQPRVSVFAEKKVIWNIPVPKCARVDQLPLFPYNRGWETQPNSRGLHTHYKDSLLKVGWPSPIQGV